MRRHGEGGPMGGQMEHDTAFPHKINNSAEAPFQQMDSNGKIKIKRWSKHDVFLWEVEK